MSSTTKIAWTQMSWNPITGCTPVSKGCDHCYAQRIAKRLKAMGSPRYANGFEVTCHPDALEEPLHWRKPRMVFVCSMGDLFHPAVPTSFIVKTFMAMSMCPQHTFQILTKRPERMAEMCTAHPWFTMSVRSADGKRTHVCSRTVLPNVWLGTSCENQAAADKRILHLLKCPAAMRFLSLEPLLGPIALLHDDPFPWVIDLLRGIRAMPDCDDPAWDNMGTIHQVIVGGESGPGARPMNPDWARSIRDQCARANVPFFMKQMGGFPDKRSKLEDIPEDLRIREYPK